MGSGCSGDRGLQLHRHGGGPRACGRGRARGARGAPDKRHCSRYKPGSITAERRGEEPGLAYRRHGSRTRSSHGTYLPPALTGYFKAHIRRVFIELHGTDSSDLLAVALGELLKEHGGNWEGTATDLWEALADKEVEGLPQRSQGLSKKVRAMGSRSKALNVKDGWRRVGGKPQRFLQLSLKNVSDAVDAVDGQIKNVNGVNSDSEEDYPGESGKA